jgi:hypothetical protein
MVAKNSKFDPIPDADDEFAAIDEALQRLRQGIKIRQSAERVVRNVRIKSAKREMRSVVRLIDRIILRVASPLDN